MSEADGSGEKVLITKIREKINWLYDHPEFVFSAVFMAMGLVHLGYSTPIFFLFAAHHLYQGYLKEKNRDMSEQLYNVICCVGHLVAKMDELGHEAEGRAIAKEFGLTLHKNKEPNNG